MVQNIYIIAAIEYNKTVQDESFEKEPGDSKRFFINSGARHKFAWWIGPCEWVAVVGRRDGVVRRPRGRQNVQIGTFRARR